MREIAQNHLPEARECTASYSAPAPATATGLGPAVNIISLGGGFGGRTVEHHHHHYGTGERRDDKKMDDGSRVLIGILAAVVMAVGSFFIGRIITQRSEASENLDLSREFRKDLEVYRNNAPGNDHLAKINKVSKACKRMSARNKNSATWSLALRVGLVAGAALALLGVVVIAPEVLLLGGALGLGSGCGLLGKLGIEWGDHKNKKDAEAIIKQIDELEGLQRPIMTMPKPPPSNPEVSAYDVPPGGYEASAPMLYPDPNK